MIQQGRRKQEAGKEDCDCAVLLFCPSILPFIKAQLLTNCLVNISYQTVVLVSVLLISESGVIDSSGLYSEGCFVSTSAVASSKQPLLDQIRATDNINYG